MKIKFRIALLFTLLVTLILLVLNVSVYYFSSLTRKKEFSTRLRNRALTTTRLLLEVEEINRSMLRKIDSLTMTLLFEERIAIYDSNNSLLYNNRTEGSDPLLTDPGILNKIRASNEYRFTAGEYVGVGVIYHSGNINYTVMATAIDRLGIAELSRLRKILLYSGLVGVFITLLVGYFFSTGLLRPLSRINKEMNDISLQNISKRVEVNNKKDELNELAQTFNNLLDRLEVSINNQSRFIANASHELSTPLAAISSQLEVTLMQNRNEKEYRDTLVSVHEDVVHLNNLVRKLLELAKAGAGKGISLAPVRLDEIALKAAEEVNTLHKEYSASVQFDEIPEEESLCYIYGNEDLLFIAFKNIIENACKYSLAHKAWMTISLLPTEKIIRIKDEGIGMTPEEAAKIFEPFFRSSKAENITDGLGLGLAMSSRIIRLHKGEIKVQSEPGKGSVFTISFPSL
jgi:two-component system sensor histidine kinase ArlS